MAIRDIRSFVRREGRMTAKQKQALSELGACYVLEPKQSQLDFAAIFKNENPVVLEIGFGMGQSLFAMAEQNQNTNFIGIEVYRPGIGALLANLEKTPLKNIQLIEGDAKEILQNNIKDESLSGLQLFFPDPWPKKKHHKRRLFQSEFLAFLATKIQSGGFVHVATDWANYAEHIAGVFAQQDVFFQAKNNEEARARRASTKFESRGERLGHDIADFFFIKK